MAVSFFFNTGAYLKLRFQEFIWVLSATCCSSTSVGPQGDTEEPHWENDAGLSGRNTLCTQLQKCCSLSAYAVRVRVCVYPEGRKHISLSYIMSLLVFHLAVLSK